VTVAGVRHRQLRPYQQGSLDALCGPYAVLNAVRLVTAPYRRLTSTACLELFAELMTELAERGWLHAALTEGCGPRQMVRLVARAKRWLRDRHGLELVAARPFAGRGKRHGGKLLTVMAQHLSEPARAVLLGTVDHWTVVRGISSRRLVLFDSDGSLYLRCPSAARVEGKRLGEIWLPGVFLVGMAGE
jgi:hypothetical protein